MQDIIDWAVGNFVWEDRNGNGYKMHLSRHTECYGDLDGDRCVWQSIELSDHETAMEPMCSIIWYLNVHGDVYTPGQYVQEQSCRSRRRPTKDSNANVTWVLRDDNIDIRRGEYDDRRRRYYRCSQVGDYVWIDENRNGTQDAG